MIPGINPNPSYSPAPACEALVCSRRAYRIAVCREEWFGYRWMREFAEDRAVRVGKGKTFKAFRWGMDRINVEVKPKNE